MNKTLSFFLALLIFASMPMSFAQKKSSKSKASPTYDITFKIKGAQDTIVYMTVNFDGKYLLRDSARASAPGVYHFKGTNKIEKGFYTLIAQKRIPYCNFVIGDNPFFTMNLDTTGRADAMSVKNNPDNEIVVAFQQRTAIAQEDVNRYVEAKKHFETAGQPDSASYYQQKLEDLNTEMLAFIDNLIKDNPNLLFAKMQKAYQAIDVPEFKDAEGSIDNDARATYYFTHYWDNIDLGDGSMVYTPILKGKFQEYFEKILVYQEIDTINKYVDFTLGKCTDSLTYQYAISYLSRYYETAKNIGFDGVFVHIVKNNQLKNKCFWMDEELIAKYNKRVERLEPLLIGQHAPELMIPDTNDEWRYSFRQRDNNPNETWRYAFRKDHDYIILWFFDPDCQECRRETKKLRAVYDSLEVAGTRNFDVFAIANDCTPERWKRYVKEEGHPWLVVGGNKGNIDYLEAYNTYETGNPTMFILNKNHDIILNKRIPINMIPSFLSQYEKIEQNKLKRQGKL